MVHKARGSGRLANHLYVLGLQTAIASGVGLGLEAYLLAFSKGLVSVSYDRGEMYEYIVTTIVVGDKAEAFFCVKPFDCSLIHFCTS